MTRPDRANTCAVMVTYQPDSGLEGRISRILPHADKLVIVDNSSTGTAAETLERLSAAAPGIQIIRNDRNLGVAAALNRGVAAAQAGGYRWAVTFDQDTLVWDNLMREFQTAYDSYPQKDRIAVIGSNYWDPVRGGPLVAVKGIPPHPWVERAGVVTSGSLVSLAVFETLGTFLPDLFIDYVDVEYCIRARSRGFRVLLALRPAMEHSLGLGRAHAMPWGTVFTPGYPPARWYYMARNSVFLALRYFKSEPRWIGGGMVHTAMMFVKVLSLEPNRLTKLRHAAAGLADGLRSGKQIRRTDRIYSRMTAG